MTSHLWIAALSATVGAALHGIGSFLAMNGKCNSILKGIKNVSQQTEALSAEVEQVINVIQAATPLIDASVKLLESHADDNAADAAAIEAATAKLKGVREAFAVELGKLTPMKTPSVAEAATNEAVTETATR